VLLKKIISDAKNKETNIAIKMEKKVKCPIPNNKQNTAVK